MNRQTKQLATCAAILFSVAAALAQEGDSDYQVTRDTPSWFKASFLDFPEDVREAAVADKRLMIYFGQDGCPYCKKLHNANFRQANIVSLLRNRFDSLAINLFGDLEVIWTDGKLHTEKTLSRRLGIQFTPTLLFLDENGREILRLSGYQPPERFLTALRYVSEARETSLPFPDYLRQQTAHPSPTTSRPPEFFAQPPYPLSSPGKPTAILIIQKNCAACREWQDFLASEKASPWRNHFQYIQIDLFGKAKTVDGKISEEEWAHNQRIAFVPALVFLDKNGGERFRVDGYLRPYHLESVIEYIATGADAKEKEFQRFLHDRTDRIRDSGGEVNLW